MWVSMRLISPACGENKASEAIPQGDLGATPGGDNKGVRRCGKSAARQRGCKNGSRTELREIYLRSAGHGAESRKSRRKKEPRHAKRAASERDAAGEKRCARGFQVAAGAGPEVNASRTRGRALISLYTLPPLIYRDVFIVSRRPRRPTVKIRRNVR